MTDALNGLTKYTYAPGRDSKLLTQVTDANGHATSFGYDAQARLTSVTNALGQTKTSQYDAKSNLAQTTNARGQTISYSYDNLDRLTRKTLPEGQINFGYDAAGNLTSASHYNGSSIQNTYDALNRLTQQVQTLPNGFAVTIGYGYDAAGNRTSMTTPWGNFSYSYDANNRLTSITNPQSKVFTFSYDAAGRRTQMNYPNGVQTNYSYDAAGQVLSITATRTSDSVVVSSVAYAYDAAGNRTSMTDAEGTHAYTYDNLHRLTGAQHPAATVLPVPNETFSYDPVGNRLADAQIGGYTYDNANRLTQNSSFTYTYDADGNQTEKMDKSTNGRMVFAFNGQNEMTQVATPSSMQITYQYDAIGRQIQVSSGSAMGQRIYFIYDGQNLLAILEADSSVRAVFTYGLNVDEPVELKNSNSADYFYHLDGQGNVAATSDSMGNLAEKNYFSVFGDAFVRNFFGPSANAGNPLLYAARTYDLNTRTYDLRKRIYDPQIGRFLSADPISVSVNTDVYLYASDAPTNYVDPSGWDVFRVNRQIAGQEPYNSWDALSHTFILVTDQNGGILHTYSWGNKANTRGWNVDQLEDRNAAFDALFYGNVTLTKVGDAALDPWIAAAFNILNKPANEHQNLGIARNCKSEATKLVDLAKKLQGESFVAP